MAYLVRTMPRAERDLEEIYDFITAETSSAAHKWFKGLVTAIESLAEHPLRNPSITEDPKLHHLLYGNKPHIYRIIYAIDRKAQRVDIIHVRHHARQTFQTHLID